MSKAEIKQLLETHSAGLTLGDISKLLGKDLSNVTKQVKGMELAYIDHWVWSTPQWPNRWVAVYALADVPEDCLMPKEKPVSVA